MINFLRLLPLAWKLGISTGVIVALLGAYAWHRHQIYQEGYQAAVVQLQHELELQKAANDEAMRLREKDYLRSVDKLMIEKDNLNDRVLDLTAEAAADPDADACGIGARSVQRLNNIR